MPGAGNSEACWAMIRGYVEVCTSCAGKDSILEKADSRVTSASLYKSFWSGWFFDF